MTALTASRRIALHNPRPKPWTTSFQKDQRKRNIGGAAALRRYSATLRLVFSGVQRQAIGSRPDWVIDAIMQTALEGQLRLRPWFFKWFQKLQDCRKLKDGWDSYNAPAPSPTAIGTATLYLVLLSQYNQEPSRVTPSVVGAVGITLRNGPRKAYVEFYSNGKVCILFSDGKSEPTVRDVTSTRRAFREVIRESVEYLHE